MCLKTTPNKMSFGTSKVLNYFKANIKIKLFRENVLFVLLYLIITWKEITFAIRKFQTFIDSCLRRVIGAFWPEATINLRVSESGSDSG